MNKILKLIISAFFLFTITVVIPNNHEHDENCGYDPSTQTGCIYEINSYMLPPDDLDPND